MNKSFYLKIFDKILGLFTKYNVLKAHYLLNPSKTEGFRTNYRKIELLQAFNETSTKKNRCDRGFRNTTLIQLKAKDDKEVEQLTANYITS